MLLGNDQGGTAARPMPVEVFLSTLAPATGDKARDGWRPHRAPSRGVVELEFLLRPGRINSIGLISPEDYRWYRLPSLSLSTQRLRLTAPRQLLLMLDG